MTSDEPGLFYAGDRTLFWLLHPRTPHALDLGGPEPAGFSTPFLRFPDWRDPMHYPVLPSFVAAATSAVAHGILGWGDEIDGHHLGLVLFHAFGLWMFCRWAVRLLGPAAGIAATVSLAVYPTVVGHAFNNPKDLPCAIWSGIALLAAAVGVLENRGRPLVVAGLFFGVSLSCKLNALLGMAALAVWLPIAYLLLYHRRQRPSAEVLVGAAVIPYIALASFVLLWPWLYQGGGVARFWERFQEYVGFMLSFGTGERDWWTAYPLRAILFMTPPALLAAALTGLVAGLRQGGAARATVLLFLIAGGLPVFRIAAPKSFFYDANRHFLEYIPALCALAGLGAVTAARTLGRALARLPEAVRPARVVGSWVAGAAALASVLLPIVKYRPYETSYFNGLIGGLGGAQRAGVFHLPLPHGRRTNGTEGDYWWSSLRRAVRTARNVDPGAPIALCGGAVELLPASFRDGPQASRFTHPDDPRAIVVVIPREGFCPFEQVRALETRRAVLRRIEREGGLVWELLGPETGQTFPPPTAQNRYTTVEAAR